MFMIISQRGEPAGSSTVHADVEQNGSAANISAADIQLNPGQFHFSSHFVLQLLY
mgnify:FL=1